MKHPDENARKELEDLSPRLLKMREQGDGFRLPEDYFQRLQHEVLEKIQTQESTSNQPGAAATPSWLDKLLEQLLLLLQPRLAMGLVTIALLITLGIVWFSQNTSSSSVSAELAKIETTTLNAYIQDNLHEFDTETLLEFASKQEQQSGFEDLPPAELDEYLDEMIQEMDAETFKELL